MNKILLRHLLCSYDGNRQKGHGRRHVTFAQKDILRTLHQVIKQSANHLRLQTDSVLHYVDAHGH